MYEFCALVQPGITYSLALFFSIAFETSAVVSRCFGLRYQPNPAAPAARPAQPGSAKRLQHNTTRLGFPLLPTTMPRWDSLAQQAPPHLQHGPPHGC